MATAPAHLHKTLHTAAGALGLKPPPTFRAQKAWERRESRSLAARRAVRRRSLAHGIAALCPGDAREALPWQHQRVCACIVGAVPSIYTRASRCLGLSYLQRRILIKEAEVCLPLPQLLLCLVRSGYGSGEERGAGAKMTLFFYPHCCLLVRSRPILLVLGRGGHSGFCPACSLTHFIPTLVGTWRAKGETPHAQTYTENAAIGPATNCGNPPTKGCPENSTYEHSIAS